MANLGPQKINFSYDGLLQVAGGITSELQIVTDGLGNHSGFQVSSLGIGGSIISNDVNITGGTINDVVIGDVTPSDAYFTDLYVDGITTLNDSLTGLLKADSGVVSTATAGVDYVSPAVLGVANGVATLDSNAKVPVSQIPSIAVTEYLGAVSSQAAMLALVGQEGDWCTRTDLGTNWIITGNDPSSLSSWTELSYPTAPVTSVNGLTGAVSLSYSNVGAAPATTGSSILYANGSGGFSGVTVGSGLSFISGTLSASAASGTVTSVSVVSANGFSGTVADPTTTPAITISTSVTGVLKGNGSGAIVAATSGTDYSAGTASLATGLLKSTTGTGDLSRAIPGTDYAPATSGTAILKGSGTGGFSDAISGTDYAPATSGTSILKGDGAGGFSNAVAGTDYAGLSSANTFTNNQVISVSSSSDALLITQTGAGNALVVEDSANPDSTPFVVDSSGLVIQGNSSPLSIAGNTSYVQQHGISANTSAIASVRWQSTSSAGPQYIFGKSKSGTVGTYAIVGNGEGLGTINFVGDDGAAFIQAASISAYVDGVPGTSDMPGRLVFSTTADGASSPTERMRIDNAGQVGIGATPSAGTTLRVGKALTGATSVIGVYNSQTIQSDVTATAALFSTYPLTAAAAFTLTNLQHYSAAQNTIGAGSAVTNQYGFIAQSNLTGATNNYGFYSNIASGTGRWNFYANGTAANYFAGDTTIAGTTTLATSLTGLLKGTSGVVSTATAGTDYVTPTGTETLTNKRITPRVLASTANSATPTLNTDSYDMMVITGQSVAITSFTTNLTGTPTNGQKLWISITGTTAIAITWGASFEASTVALPTTTVTTNRLDVGFVWNVATSKWRCVASA